MPCLQSSLTASLSLILPIKCSLGAVRLSCVLACSIPNICPVSCPYMCLVWLFCNHLI